MIFHSFLIEAVVSNQMFTTSIYDLNRVINSIDKTVLEQRFDVSEMECVVRCLQHGQCLGSVYIKQRPFCKYVMYYTKTGTGMMQGFTHSNNLGNDSERAMWVRKGFTDNEYDTATTATTTKVTTIITAEIAQEKTTLDDFLPDQGNT